MLLRHLEALIRSLDVHIMYGIRAGLIGSVDHVRILYVAKRIYLMEKERFICRDGVDVVKLLRAVRAFLYEKAEGRGANVLVEEQ